MVSAVRYLHTQLIVHRDIKLESTASILFTLLRLKWYVSSVLFHTNDIQTFFSTSLCLLCLYSRTHRAIRMP
jgi:serine/threonine protein kinase